MPPAAAERRVAHHSDFLMNSFHMLNRHTLNTAAAAVAIASCLAASAVAQEIQSSWDALK